MQDEKGIGNGIFGFRCRWLWILPGLMLGACDGTGEQAARTGGAPPTDCLVPTASGPCSDSEAVSTNLPQAGPGASVGRENPPTSGVLPNAEPAGIATNGAGKPGDLSDHPAEHDTERPIEPVEVASMDDETESSLGQRLQTRFTSADDFEMWICGAASARVFGYLFVDHAGSRVGQEIDVQAAAVETFEWQTNDVDRLISSGTANGLQVELGGIRVIDEDRFVGVSSRRGALTCFRETIGFVLAAGRTILERPAELPAAEADEDSVPSGSLATALTTAHASVDEFEFWICQVDASYRGFVFDTIDPATSTGLAFEAGPVQEVESKPGQVSNRGRWSTLDEQSVRLELDRDGEISLTDIRFESTARFRSVHSLAGPLSCERDHY